MSKKIIVIGAQHAPPDQEKTNVWWKIDNYFINQNNIRALSRKGKHSLVRLYHGDDLTVHVDYDKLKILLPSDRNKI